jgi:hypothetical protein
MSRNGKRVGIGTGYKPVPGERCHIPPDAHPLIRQYFLFDALTNYVIPFDRKLISDPAKIERVIAEWREKEAKNTSEVYGPSHPQSWESLYGVKRKLTPEEELKSWLGL